MTRTFIWACGLITVFLTLYGIPGSSALQCYECYNNTATNQDCRYVSEHQRKVCPNGHDDVCVTNLNANTHTGEGMVVVYSRYCARLTDPAGRHLAGANPNSQTRQDCNSIVDGHKIQIRCSCNNNLCNSHDRVYLPDGRYIAAGATALHPAVTCSTLLFLLATWLMV